VIRILHVDDDSSDHELLRWNLQKLDKDLLIEWAGSARSALEMLSSREYDCVLSDYQMPGMDGLELLETLRGENNDTPLILLTGQGNEDVAAKALRDGADDYFTKETGFAHYDRLMHSIRKAVRAREDREERRRAEERVKHLNLILKAIRNVNQMIIKEKDPAKILSGACECLVETRGYYSARIALLDDDNNFTECAGSGQPGGYAKFKKRLLSGEPVACFEEALRHPGIVTSESIGALCSECPLLNPERERGH